jgi:hypothetical protein
MVQGLNPTGQEDFLHSSRLALGPTSILYSEYWVSFLGCSSQGVAVTTNPHL